MGHTSSYLRFCGDCLRREMSGGGETRAQYYHRYPMAYLLCEEGRVLLDLEPQRKGAGEIRAATRLVQRLHGACPRAFNAVAGGALYLDPALCTRILKHEKDFLAVLKNEARGPVKDFRGLLDFEGAAPLRFKYNGKQCCCHGIEGFASWTQLGHDVRVARCEETSTLRRPRRKKQETITAEWLWATSLSKEQADTRMIVRVGHGGRWDIENRGFNELVNEWHADHVYRRNPHAIVAILLPLFLFYNLYHVWVARGLKPRLRDRYTTAHFAKPVAAEFYNAPRHLT